MQTSTCDRCRRLKVKCALSESSPRECERCSKAKLTCTFEYEFKKSGRPSGSRTRRSSASPRRTAPRSSPHHSPPSREVDAPQEVNQRHERNQEPLFGSARTAFEGAGNTSQPWMSGLWSRRHSFDYTVPEYTAPEEVAPSQSPEDGAISLAISSEIFSGVQSLNTSPRQDLHLNVRPPEDFFSNLGGPLPVVEDIGTWSEFCFFISRFMRHQHALVPLVHKPTFAMDVLNRRDQHDEAFRGLLFSVVSYTICQSPINMMSNDFTRERLLELLNRCQRISRLIQLRQASRINLVTAASTELDILSSQATNKTELTAALLADAQRNIYALRLNAPGPTTIDVEIGRRIFWHLHTTDKTNIMNGGHTLIHHQDGLPPLPLELDDEQLGPGLSLPTLPPTDSIYISGFVKLIKVFIILGECQSRHRTLLNDPESGQEATKTVAWLESATKRLRDIMDVSQLTFDGREVNVQSAGDKEAIEGIQKANLCITALCTEFALMDLRLAIQPWEDLQSTRQSMAKQAYTTLSSIPIEYLASNGEAMRGKVLRTILALFNTSHEPQELENPVWDWWSMVQFLQVIPA